MGHEVERDVGSLTKQVNQRTRAAAELGPASLSTSLAYDQAQAQSARGQGA